MAKYTKKQAELGIRFWKKALNEAIAAESEEDQKKENGEEEAKDTGAEDEVGTEEDATAADETADETDTKIAELEARIAELEAKLDSQSANDIGSEETMDSDDSDDSDDSEDSEDSEDSKDSESDDDDDDDADDDDDDDTKLDESSYGSTKYAPNTVGAVVALLNKFNPQSQLMIRLSPNKEECMVIDIDGKITVNGPGVTYMEIARGTPMTDFNESKATEKPAKKCKTKKCNDKKPAKKCKTKKCQAKK